MDIQRLYIKSVIVKDKMSGKSGIWVEGGRYISQENHNHRFMYLRKKMEATDYYKCQGSELRTGGHSPCYVSGRYYILLDTYVHLENMI